MKIIDSMIKENIPIWDECILTTFLSDLSSQKLDTDCFKGYLIDDTLYLIEYAKVFGHAIIKCNNYKDLQKCYSLLSYINDEENVTRHKYLKHFNLDDEIICKMRMRHENKLYTEFMINTVANGSGMPECMAAVLPCMLSYLYIFRKIITINPDLLSGFYSDLISDYISDEYEIICAEWCKYTEELFQNLSEERIASLKNIFLQSSIHELNFWKMCSKPRNN